RRYQGTRGDLPLLQRVLADRTLQPLPERARAAVELLFGEILVRELSLSWVMLEGPQGYLRAVAMGDGKRLLPLNILGPSRAAPDLPWLFQVIEQALQLEDEWVVRQGMHGELLGARRKRR